jgi:hypothetical protein
MIECLKEEEFNYCGLRITDYDLRFTNFSQPSEIIMIVT